MIFSKNVTGVKTSNLLGYGVVKPRQPTSEGFFWKKERTISFWVLYLHFKRKRLEVLNIYVREQITFVCVRNHAMKLTQLRIY